jgi:DGQHR domain-containing protein
MDQPFKDPNPITKTVPALRIRQPIGEIFLAAIDHALLQKITYFDVRRVLRDTRDVEAYLGIQRPLNERRVEDLEKYVNFVDATFPTAVILAIDESDCVSYDDSKQELTLSNVRVGNTEPDIAFSNLCRVIDGQHRIAGLDAYKGEQFQVMTAIFVGSDIADQAYVFATVNLEQTKVRKSLAFDLFDLARTRSPYKTCHNVAVALDTIKDSPLFHRIKRLGTATPGRDATETISQSTFVDGLIRYISAEPKVDRDLMLRGEKLDLAHGEMLRRYCLRNLFIKDQDVTIGRIIQNYFDAVRATWPTAWNNFGQGAMLNKTNGFRAFISIFGRVYTYLGAPGDLVESKKFYEMFKRSKLKDEDFNIEEFKPGTSGEAKLRNNLLEDLFGDQRT